jgi:hypothetical protein
MTFRGELPEEQLWWSYTTPVEFERLVRAHLEDVIVRRRAAQTTSEPKLDVRSRSRGTVRFGLPLVGHVFVGRARELAALEEALAVADRAGLPAVDPNHRSRLRTTR